MTHATQTAPSTAPSTATAPETVVPTRWRVGAAVAAAAALGVVIGTVVAIHAIDGYLVAANLVVALALVGAAYGLLRGRHGWDGRVLAVLLGWVTAFGVTCEAGIYQNRMNVTDELGAQTTSYFLPGIVWVGLIALFAAAVAIMLLTKRARGDA